MIPLSFRPNAAAIIVLALAGVALVVPHARAQLQPVVPPEMRGRIDAERSGFHDAANIRTVFWNFGMVGDFPADAANVDLSVFHSVEVPKGSGMNYSDGITPFVLAKIVQKNGLDAYIMETGFRERQAESPLRNRIMRFEPRPGFFQPNSNINKGRSPAISNDPRTWPNSWPDKQNDSDDPGWAGDWNGYFGKRPAADQESFTVMDDDFYDAWDYDPDSRDVTRRGLGLRIEVRGFQWANPQAGNVVFWHYDITNESTTDYNDDIIFGLYMDSGVGGSAYSCDGIFESDDDNAFFDKSSGLNLVYTYDRYGHGRDLSGSCGTTGYLGYAYLETPGNPFNSLDDDNDGILNEKRDAGPGTQIVGDQAILAYVAANYDTAKFVTAFGPIASKSAYRAGVWWTGDEDMDWSAPINDVGADGVADTDDTGEDDGVPTEGEPNFDRTDLNESDQIGLTGFKMNRIKAGQGNPNTTTDGIVFYTGLGQDWPKTLFEKFTDPVPAARFDSATASNYNIGFLFASGPFQLKAGKTERFSLALAYGAGLTELRSTVTTVQQIYNANYQFAVPPPLPTVTAETGDGRVQLSWNDIAERGVDPVTNEFDFEGYRIYRATDPDFRDVRVVTSGTGTSLVGNGKPIAQFDLKDGRAGFSGKTVEGVAYWLGSETGITHTWTDHTAVNGQEYYYAVCAYDYGFDSPFDSLAFYPSENSITVSRTPRGGVILPTNVVRVRPGPRVQGFERAAVDSAAHVRGDGVGTLAVEVVNSGLVPDGHLMSLTFTTPSPDSIRATAYTLRDSTGRITAFTTGADLAGLGNGAVGFGLQPVLNTPPLPEIDVLKSGYVPGGPTNTRLKASYQVGLSKNLRRVGYPDDISIVFDDVVRDTGLAQYQITAKPAKFRIIAHTLSGDAQLDFRFNDLDGNGTLSTAAEYIDINTYAPFAPTTPQITYRVALDTLGQGLRGAIVPPRLGDVYELKVKRPFGTADEFVFGARGQRVAGGSGRGFDSKPYVVPNPYVGAASFEPERFAVSGRGERRLEFRAIPLGASIRIYTVDGDLVQTLRQDGSNEGYVAWNLRTKDNLDMSPGLYIFHVDAPGVGTHIGKFAVVK